MQKGASHMQREIGTTGHLLPVVQMDSVKDPWLWELTGPTKPQIHVDKTSCIAHRTAMDPKDPIPISPLNKCV